MSNTIKNVICGALESLRKYFIIHYYVTYHMILIYLYSYSLLAGRPPFEGKCGSVCGWDDGEPCDECQDSLFNAIQSGKLEFPDHIFRNVSRDVIDLVRFDLLT